MNRRQFVKTSLAATAALAAPQIVRAEAQKTINFVPHADLASLDPVWTTADITRNFSLAVYDTLFGYDAEFRAQPQMVQAHTTEDGGKLWDLTLRDGLEISRRRAGPGARLCRHDQAMGQALSDGAGADGPHRRIIRGVRQGHPVSPEEAVSVIAGCTGGALLRGDAGAAGQDRRLRADQGSHRLRAIQIRGVRAHTRAARRFREEPGLCPARRPENRASAPVPRWFMSTESSGISCRIPRTASAALAQGEVDWWENPTIDLIPQLKRNKDLVITVKDRTGEIGCLRFNHLYPPFDNPAVRRVVLSAMDQKEVMTAVAGAEPSLIKTDVGLFCARHSDGELCRRRDHAGTQRFSTK